MAGPRLLLIDGMNLCFREFYSKKQLSHKGRHVDVLYGVFKSLISYHKKWSDHFRIVAWEGGYERRLRESEEGVRQGIIPSTYKQPRREKAAEPDPEIEPLFEQIAVLKELLARTKTLQVRMEGFEADDVLHSYAKWAVKYGGEAVIVSSDKDYYQCLQPGVKVYNAGLDDMWTYERFCKEFGFPPSLWLDKGALEGEVGPSKDNIFGVDGWGPTTACKYVAEFGDIDAIRAAIEGKKKLGKREQTFLDQQPRLKLAKSLKRMDMIPDLPRPRILANFAEADVKRMFLEWGFASLLKDARRFV